MKTRRWVSLSTVTFAALSLAGSAYAQDRGAQKTIYDKNCKKCHADDGSGKKPDGEWLPVAKSLKLEKPEGLNILSADAKKVPDADILKSMTDGKGKMKSLKDKMSEDEMKQMVDYTRHLQSQAK